MSFLPSSKNSRFNLSQSSFRNKAAAIVLALSVLLSTTPAAAKTTVDLVHETSLSLWFWYYSSGLAKLVQGQGSGKIKEQEKQRDRDAKVQNLQIFPGDVTVDLGEHVRFTAAAVDLEGNPVGGVKVKWTVESEQNGRRARLSKDGDFEAVMPGTFAVIAHGAGRTARTNVVVRPGSKPDLKAPATGTREVSTRDLPENAAGGSKANKIQKLAEPSSAKGAVAKRAHSTRAAKNSTPAPMMLSNGWDGTNYWSADDPGNTIGDPPGRPPDSAAGSGNFQFSAPVIELPSRGLNIALALTYNARLWNKASNQINYDNDKGWPAPGFAMGVGPKLLGMTINSGCMLVEPDGTRHAYSGSITFYSWGTVGVMHTTDGSFIDYTYQTGTNGVITWAQAKLPNGTLINYGAYSQPGGGVFPTFIEDANGNYITITYLNNQGPRIQTITDTAGRVINFYYNGSSLLTAVTAPTLTSGTRTLLRLHYHQHTLNPGFSGLTANSANWTPWVIDGIYYPGTSTGYWLNDSDSYSSYGMLAKVVEQRSMGFSSSGLTDMGTISQGSTTRSLTYNYPLTPNYSLTDAPTFTTAVESWTRDGTNFDSATTSYESHENDTPRTTIVTMPNGTKNRQYSYNAAGQWYDGLIYRDETYVTDGQPFQISKSFWEQGAYGSPRTYRVEKTDERNQTTAAEFTYGSVYNQVTEVRDYDYGGTSLLRATRTTYQNSTNYTGTCNIYGCYGRHIFNLPLTVEIYAADYTTRVSRTEYQYDGQTLIAAPNVVMHDQAANPHAEEEGFCYWDYDWNDPDCWGGCYDYSCDGYCNQIWVCPYDYSTEFRGNVTQMTTYADAVSLTGGVTETRQYDVTGNLIKSSTSCCQQTSYSFTVDTQYAYPQSKTNGSATDAYAQITSSATYDFNTGLPLSTTNANNRQSTITYNSTSLRPISGVSATGAHTDTAYDDGAMTITTTSYLASGAPDYGAITNQNVKYMNGRGQVRQERALASGGLWDIVDTTYTNMGDISQQTRPYRSGDTLQWSTAAYDALGRVTSVTGADGSVSENFYNEASRPNVASSTAGETTRTKDQWGRERWGRTDSSGRLVEIVEPDPNGSGAVATNGMVTTYAYNTLGRLTTITQGSQTRSFKYDALGRLLAQRLSEMNATLNDSGTYVGSGTWTDVFTYDDRSNVTSRTDARGVKAIYTYNNDPLNRLQSISWDTSGFGDSANPILGAATVTYSYRTKDFGSQRRDVTQVSTISTAGVNTESFSYDNEGRVSVKQSTLSSRSSYPFATDYLYDSLDRPRDIIYPAEYGNGGSPRRTVHQDYDVASRIATVSFNGQLQASNINYNAASQPTSITVGTGTNQVSESYSYHAPTGLLDNQTVTRNGSTLLNLSYDFADGNGKRTGQLLKITNNLDSTKNRGYEYDALGRLKRATGGQNVNWSQRYFYDRYGNRNNVFSHTAEQYIRNFYQSALDRQPNSSELNTWSSTLQTAYAQGTSQFWSAMQSLGAAVFTSQEYANRGRSDHWYVYDLYKAYLWRDPDAGGWSFWEQGCAQNGRNAVRAGFDWSLEFELHVSGTAPYNPPGGATVPNDGWGSLSYDTANNHIVNSGWSYDATGNQTRVQVGAGWQRFQYDAANRLVRVKADDNVTVLASYTYGDSSERLIAEEGGQRTYYACNAKSEYVESGGSTTPAWSKSYVFLGSRVVSTMTPNGGSEAAQYHHPDRLGTRVVTTPATGQSFEQVHLPFGTALPSESTGATNQRFTSYDRSATTGLDYAVNRSYDSAQGRFTQVDPAGMNATSVENPQSLNLYAYCSNDPVNRTDPDGLGLFSWLKKVFKRIVKAFIHAVIAGLVAFVMSGFNIGAGIAVFAADFAAQLGIQSQGYWRSQIGTPPTFPTAGITLSQIFQGTILSRLFPSPQDLWKYVIPINGFMPMQGSLLNPCTFNINIYGATGDLLRDIQSEITRIFATGGLNVVFNNPRAANGGSTNLYIQGSFSASVLDSLRREHPGVAAAGGTIPGYTPARGNSSYVDRWAVFSAGARGGGVGTSASLGTMIGRVGAHEVIQHRFLGFTWEGTLGPFYGGFRDITWSGTPQEGANFLRDFRSPNTMRFNIGSRAASSLRSRCP
jgi:RHS repeat-associated protein